MHLAAAVGAPTIALNGPTSAARWGPIGPNVVCVDSELPGCGYLNLGFEYDGRRTDCMQGISVERVATAVRERARG
jgi:ADP-heptose:LPS heptosyltransferase